MRHHTSEQVVPASHRPESLKLLRSHAMTEPNAPTPNKPIRRFDVFAEVKRLEALAEGRPEDEAKGYGIWVAKVVAGRRFGHAKGERPDRKRVRQEGETAAGDREEGRFKHAGDELQTDETFDRE